MARIITITSGKGGVGKTSISLNLSLALASKGHRVCLFDADLGLANVNILTGIYPKQDLVHVMDGEADLADILIKGYQGIDIIPGSSGVSKLANLKPVQTQRLIQAFLDLEDYDYFIFDTSAGISSQVLSFCMASHEIILVATCEPTSITDAYSMLKTLSKYGYDNPVKIVLNQVKTGKSAKSTYAQLKETVRRFLNIKLEPLGIVGWDKRVRMAVISQNPFVLLFPDSLASKCVRAVADKLIEKAYYAADTPLEIFWDTCLRYFEKIPVAQKTDPVFKQEESKPLKEEKTQTPPQNSEPHHNEHQVQKAIDDINVKLSNMMKEVAGIKKLLEDQKVYLKTKPAPAPPKEQVPEPKKITLDFESWLANNRKQFS